MPIPPDLRFGLGTSSGFTPAGIAAFDNLRPAAVVRELIQNALDAAREAGVTPAIVRFRMTRMRRSAVPGIQSYEKAFKRAIDTQEEMTGGVLSGQAQLVVERIRSALDREELDVLSVLDNGVGLDPQRMNALLSDGLSVKAADATGTYGNGHSTVIPVSDLRYVLYGGLTKKGQRRSRIGAGHAVLASYVEGRKLRAGDGFYIRNFQAGDKRLYDYATGRQLPPLITQALDWIASEAQHGTAVIIPAFNHFLEEQSLQEMVSHAASANFFVAIEEGELEVSVEDHRSRPHTNWSLDRLTLAEALEAHQDKRRARAFLNGRRAFEAHQAYRSGERHHIVTQAGEIEIRLRQDNPAAITRIDLCRNGMWITDNIPMLRQRLGDQVPFHAILSLNAREGKDLYNLIRDAEGPLHDAITIKLLPGQRRKECRSALTQIADWIKRNTRTVKSDSYMSDEYLTLDFGDEDGKGRGKSRNFWGAPVLAGRHPTRQRLPRMQDASLDGDGGEPSGSDPGGTTSNPPRSRHRRPSLPTFFQAASCPAGRNRRRILIECERSCSDAELRLVVDEALDATCERPGQDPYTPAVLGNITINGTPASDEDLIRWDNEIIGIRLGDLAERASVEVETDYQLAGDFSELPNPSLRVEIFKTEQDSDTDAEDRTGPRGES